MKKIALLVSGLLVVGLLVVFFLRRQPAGIFSPIFSKPLDKYTFENLKKRGGVASEITYDNDIFFFFSDGKKVSGKINLPVKSNGKIVVMLHGFLEREGYKSGDGTQRVAEALAKSGYTTYAPDFFGYGQSDLPSKDDLEDRFQTYTTTLDLIVSIEQNSKVKMQNSKIMIWGHSNGGQIALSILEITGQPYPTALWNPVSKPFPYNILYYTDTFEDEGKWLRGAVANFEKDYDVHKYSTTDYLSWITAPVLLQQGASDEWVPKSWSDTLNEKLRMKNIKYVVYPGADHNMLPLWNQAVGDLLSFYAKY